MGREGFEPSKAEPTDLQSVAFNHFAISPRERDSGMYCRKPECVCKELLVLAMDSRFRGNDILTMDSRFRGDDILTMDPRFRGDDI